MSAGRSKSDAINDIKRTIRLENFAFDIGFRRRQKGADDAVNSRLNRFGAVENLRAILTTNEGQRRMRLVAHFQRNCSGTNSRSAELTKPRKDCPSLNQALQKLGANIFGIWQLPQFTVFALQR